MISPAQDTTAILIFARSSSEEVLHKKIAKGGQLFQTLTEYTLKTVQKTSVPFFHITEEEQQGASFGERFANAIQFVFDQGFENIITIGNDSPHMTKAHLLAASSELEIGKSVIGPSTDGGFYLLGLHRTHFKKSDFATLPWQTSQLKDEVTKLLFGLSQEVFLLQTLFDIDSSEDAKIVGNHASGLTQKILKVIQSLFLSKEKIEIASFFFVKGFQSQIPFNKGSPTLITS